MNRVGVPEYIEAADHLILYSVSGVISLLSSNSDVNDGTANPAAYKTNINTPHPFQRCEITRARSRQPCTVFTRG